MTKKEIIAKLKVYQKLSAFGQQRKRKEIIELQKELVDLSPTEKQFKNGFTNLVFFPEIVWYITFRGEYIKKVKENK